MQYYDISMEQKQELQKRLVLVRDRCWLCLLLGLPRYLEKERVRSECVNFNVNLMKDSRFLLNTSSIANELIRFTVNNTIKYYLTVRKTSTKKFNAFLLTFLFVVISILLKYFY